MTKRHYKALEQVWGAEVENRLPFQSKAKIYSELEGMGLVKHDTERLGADRFGIIEVSGWYLTHAGRLSYCLSC